MKPLLLLTALSLLPSLALAQENLVANGDMERLGAGKDVPDVWQSAGDPKFVTQTLSADAGREGGHSLKLACTAFQGGNPACHVMACQMGQVGVQRGKWYKVTLWAKQEGLDDNPISISLTDTKVWTPLGLYEAFQAEPDWSKHEFVFQATGDCHETTRFQIWFTSTGTLWLDDVSFVETTMQTAPTLIWPAAGHKNLLPNGGFEVGSAGWGSIGDFPSRGWPLPLNNLVGEVVTQGAHDGSRCLEIALTPQTLPVDYFDYYGMTRSPAKAILAGNMGWMEVKPGAQYCLSAWIRASREDTPVRLQVQPFAGGPTSQEVRVGTSWQRYQMVFKPWANWYWVAAGPVLTKPDALPVTVWLDCVQFEAGAQPTDYEARDTVEAGISTRHDGNVFAGGTPVRVDMNAQNATEKVASIELAVSDVNDQIVARKICFVPPMTASWQQTVDLGLAKKGFYRVHLLINGQEKPRGLRLAVIPRYTGKDSIFGMNHAYPWPHLLRECVDAGLLWVRDWSIKWQHVQPTADAPFDFTETDYQINRPLAAGQEVLALLPFPSADWSSSAPPEVKVGTNYPAIRERQAYAPRDDKEFARYVAASVAHYRGRVNWYQVFNEPVFTDYSLPQGKGYTGKDYGRLVKVFAQAARQADPNCHILAGISAWPDSVEQMFRDMFAEGALDAIDAVDLHTYPGLTPPEAIEKGLPLLRDMMRQYGKVKPIWLTEHGYYADDEFEQTPERNGGFNVPLASERVQAEFSMRFNVILLAHGVDHIFYHAGTCPGLNEDNTEGVFFKYGGQPRKIYPAVAAFADLFRPGVHPLGELDWGKGTKAYLFREGDRLILAAWTRSTKMPVTVNCADTRIVPRDMMGNDLPTRSVKLGTAPVFFVAKGMTAEAMKAGIRRG